MLLPKQSFDNVPLAVSSSCTHRFNQPKNRKTDRLVKKEKISKIPKMILNLYHCFN